MSRNASVSVILLGLLLATLFPLFAPGVGEHDFLAYWSSSRLLATGGNPYDTAALRALQHTIRPQRVSEQGPAITVWNPPWLLLVLLPLGFLPFDVAVSVWVFCNTLLIGMAIIASWGMLVEPPDQRGVLIALLAGFLFVETLDVFVLGQISGLILMGLVLSVKFLKSGRQGWASIALLLTTTKPHLTYLVLLLVFAWSLRYRQWRVLSGMMVAGLSAGIIVWIILPGWILTYLSLMMSLPYSHLYTSTLGSFVGVVFGFYGFRFAGLLLFPLVFPLLRLIERWGWLTAVNMALLISVPLAPYGFGFDQVVLLPAIVQIIAWLWRRVLPCRWAWIVGGGLVGMYLVLFWMLTLSPMIYTWFVWVPLAILGLYALAWHQLSPQSAAPA